MTSQDATISISRLFGVLSHPTRVRLLGLLKDKEQDVTHIQQELGISQSGVSQHLGLLKSHGLVQERREGKHVFYRLKSQQVAQLVYGALQLITMELAADGELLQTCAEMLTIWSF